MNNEQNGGAIQLKIWKLTGETGNGNSIQDEKYVKKGNSEFRNIEKRDQLNLEIKVYCSIFSSFSFKPVIPIYYCLLSLYPPNSPYYLTSTTIFPVNILCVERRKTNIFRWSLFRRKEGDQIVNVPPVLAGWRLNS